MFRSFFDSLRLGSPPVILLNLSRLFLNATSGTHFYFHQKTLASNSFLKVLIRKLNLSRYWSSMPMSLILLHIKLNAFAKPKSVTCPVLSATESYSGVSYPLHVPGVMTTMLLEYSNFHTTLLWKLEHEHQSELLKCLQEIVQIFVHASVHYCLSDFRHPPLANFTHKGANDYPGDDVSGAQSVTEKLSDLAQNGVPVNNNQCDSGQ
ncbi:hypothetical protein Bca101_007509 [Brassica carinata]